MAFAVRHLLSVKGYCPGCGASHRGPSGFTTSDAFDYVKRVLQKNMIPAERGVAALLGRGERALGIRHDGRLWVPTEPDLSRVCKSCGSTHVVRNGKKHGRQNFRCRGCGRCQSSTNPRRFRHAAEAMARAAELVRGGHSLAVTQAAIIREYGFRVSRSTISRWSGLHPGLGHHPPHELPGHRTHLEVAKRIHDQLGRGDWNDAQAIASAFGHPLTDAEIAELYPPDADGRVSPARARNMLGRGTTPSGSARASR